MDFNCVKKKKERQNKISTCNFASEMSYQLLQGKILTNVFILNIFFMGVERKRNRAQKESIKYASLLALLILCLPPKIVEFEDIQNSNDSLKFV